MPLINWSSELSLEIEIIDLQHQQLIAMINALNDAMRLGKGKDVAEKIIEGLIDYTRTHFDTEERYFTKFGYPYTAQHVKEHIEFIKQAAQVQTDFVAGKLILSSEIINFLSDWLRDHIQGTDRKYVGFFHNKGLN